MFQYKLTHSLTKVNLPLRKADSVAAAKVLSKVCASLRKLEGAQEVRKASV